MSFAARGRPIIVDGHLRADNGRAFRGAPFFGDLFQDVADFQANVATYQPYFNDVVDTYHMNLVRISPWLSQWEIDLTNQTNIDNLLFMTDTVVNWAESKNIYAIVNAHSQFNTVINLTEIQRFWDLIAPRYKDRTHVIYEAMNEPEINSANTHMTTIYNHIRGHAPNTHIILWSFAESTEITIAFLQNHPTISYANASVGYHVYFELGDTEWDHMNNTIRGAGFPIIDTEHHSLTNANDLPIDYNFLMTCIQKAENRGLSWIQWAPYFNFRLVSKDPDWEEGQRFTSTYLTELANKGIAHWPAVPSIGGCRVN